MIFEIVIRGFCGGTDITDHLIKWIKADKSNYYSKQGKEETILWIKQFFNIKDEEIK